MGAIGHTAVTSTANVDYRNTSNDPSLSQAERIAKKRAENAPVIPQAPDLADGALRNSAAATVQRVRRSGGRKSTFLFPSSADDFDFGGGQ